MIMLVSIIVITMITVIMISIALRTAKNILLILPISILPKIAIKTVIMII